MSWGIVAGAASSLIGGSMAAGAQEDAAAQSTGEQRRQFDLTRQDSLNQYNQVRADQAPFRAVGTSAIQRLAQGMGYSPASLQQTAASLTPITQQPTLTREQLLPQYTTGARPAGYGPPQGQITYGPEGNNQNQVWYDAQPGVVDEAGLAAALAAQQSQGQQTQSPGITTDPNAEGFGDLSRSFTLADYQADPGYQFRLQQGEQGIKRAAAARGGQYSGATLKALANFNSGLASQEYGNAYSRFNTDQTTQFNRNAALADVAQTANTAVGNAGNSHVNTISNAGQNMANNVSRNMMDAGDARASGYVSASNAIGSGIRQIYNNYNENEALKRYNTGVGSLSSGGSPDGYW